MKADALKNGLFFLLALLAVGGLIGAHLRQEARAAEAAHGRIPVYYWHMWSGEWQPAMNRVVDDFNKSQTKYQVIPLQIPYASADSKFLLATAGGDPPDVMAQWTQAISTWSQDGILQPLDTRMTAAERQRFFHETYPVIHDNGLYKGHLYGMVMGVDVYACYYRADQFRQAGLDPDHFPATLEELSADARKLDRSDAGGRLTRVGFLPQDFTHFAPAFGGGFYDPATGEVQLKTTPNLRAMSYILDTSRQLGMDRVLRFNAGLKPQNGASWPFIDGSFSIALDGEWRVQQLAKFAPGLDYRVAPLPPPRGGKPLSSFSVTNFLTIPVGAKHSEGAWEFIKFWAGLDHPEQAAKYNVSFGWLPTSPQMAQSPDYQAFLRRYPQYRAFVRLAASPNLVTTPPVPYQTYLMDRITSADEMASRGTLTPEEALSHLEADVAQERARRKELGSDE